MSASTLLMPPVETGAGDREVSSREVRVEFRAATPREVREIDMTADSVVLPAHLYLTHDQWREAIAPFPIAQPVHTVTREIRSRRPPGSMVWAQLASRSGDMIVGGRDSLGLPSLPVPAGNGDVFFASVVPEPHDTDPGGAPTTRIRRLTIEPHECQPILSSDGSIRCASPDCDDCLRALTRNSWSTTIACVCGRPR